MMAAALRGRVRKFSAGWIAQNVVNFRRDNPVVSITFDDFPRTALDIGGDILNREGIVGTYYTAFGLADSDSAAGRIGGLNDLAACAERGHELACHTYDHLDCMTASTYALERNLLHNQAVARELGVPLLSHFAYPFGRFGTPSKKIVMRHYASARTVRWGVNRGRFDLGLLKSVPVYSVPGPPNLRSYFDELQSRGGWLILYTHDVSEQSSTIGCTPDTLRLVICYAREIGASILPVGAVVSELLAASISDSKPLWIPGS
jgi:peptidoglycan/xylan/chitin deacetylase (PgdA/CDA1 family)